MQLWALITCLSLVLASCKTVATEPQSELAATGGTKIYVIYNLARAFDKECVETIKSKYSSNSYELLNYSSPFEAMRHLREARDEGSHVILLPPRLEGRSKEQFAAAVREIDIPVFAIGTDVPGRDFYFGIGSPELEGRMMAYIIRTLANMDRLDTIKYNSFSIASDDRAEGVLRGLKAADAKVVLNEKFESAMAIHNSTRAARYPADVKEADVSFYLGHDAQHTDYLAEAVDAGVPYTISRGISTKQAQALYQESWRKDGAKKYSKISVLANLSPIYACDSAGNLTFTQDLAKMKKFARAMGMAPDESNKIALPYVIYTQEKYYDAIVNTLSETLRIRPLVLTFKDFGARYVDYYVKPGDRS